jgi:ATP-dependent DNA helicase DinG
LISTGTKPLQDQLFNRDLPLVRKALGKPVSAALLKGRNNYLCLHRLEQNSAEEAGLFPSRQTVAQFRLVREWARHTPDGDIGEIDSLPEDAEVWPLVTSTSDNCLGSQCPQLQACFLLKARRQANQAEVLVINHHLLFADMSLRDQGFGELLPGVHAVILDEAHQLAETAANFFGQLLTGRQCNELCKDSVKAEKTEAGDYPLIAGRARELEEAVRDLRQVFEGLPQRGAWPLVAQRPAFAPALERLGQGLRELENALGAIAERGKDLENCWRRAQELRARLSQITQAAPEQQVQWFETSPRGFMLRLTPLSVAEQFQSYCNQRKIAWVFTSATLSVGEDFSHFCAQLGLREVHTRRFESPFDFANSALLYVPPYLPEPREPDYTRAVIKAALPVLRASRGRAFLLFTSHRALQEAAGLLQEADLPYPLLIQGSLPRGQLLQRFRQLGDAILLGTGSFWEGVDVRGEALSCVIIDKLPFASPGDPVMEARIKYSREHGGNPFNEFQLPQAVISLKQGVGRLIRDVTDRGVLMICDPRLYQKSYGRTFLQSLPPLPKSRQVADVERFFGGQQA